MLTFQEIIIRLNDYWTKQGCLLQQSYDLRAGAGTFHPETFIRSLGPEPYNVCHAAVSTRPSDGRYGLNPNRLQRFTQFQVLMKPSPENIVELYLQSLEAIGLSLKDHDIRFVHDDWASPSQGAAGLGWEVWCDGMEVTQFTYFQQIGGIELDLVSAELAYGLERLVLFLQKKPSIYEVAYNDELTYGDVFLENEKQASAYNFEHADVETLRRQFNDCEKQSKRMLELNLPLPAYDLAIQASNLFNLLDARNAISVSDRVAVLHRVRTLCCGAAKEYVASREKLGFPLLKETAKKPEPEEPQLPAPLAKADDFVFEIGVENLPATFVSPAMVQVETKMKKLLDEAGLSYDSIEVYGTPKRLTAYVKNLAAATEKKILEKQGPKLAILFNESGQLTKAGQGFIRSIGLESLSPEDLESGKTSKLSVREDGYVIARIEEMPKSSMQILSKALSKLVTSLTFPKQMRWADHKTPFARPIRSILCMHGKQVIPVRINNVDSSNVTQGHAQYYGNAITLVHASKYLPKLKRSKVLACVKERKKLLDTQLDKIEHKEGLFIVERDRVLTEVIHLSEYPTLAVHTFDDSFLKLPDELLISEMIEHQKYWPLRSTTGEITNKFIVAVDRKPTPLIMENYGTVLEARLRDGLFLYEQDTKSSLEEMNELLKSVSFYKDSGSMFDKEQRIAELSRQIAILIDVAVPKRAAQLCKADLTSQVVFEFPELQGVMGKYYALNEGESEDTAIAIEEHYWPQQEGAELPTSHSGSVLAIADRLDSLCVYMKAGVKASSSKDPLGLRRSALGMLRILLENKWSMNLAALTDQKDVLDFIMQRLKGLLLEHGFKKQEVDSVALYDTYDPYKIFCCVNALHQFRKQSSDFDRLQEVQKRAHGQIADQNDMTLEPDLLKEQEELDLFSALEDIEPKFSTYVKSKEYLHAFEALTEINTPLSNFFDNVRVMAEDPKLRENRVALLQRIATMSQALVDLSKL